MGVLHPPGQDLQELLGDARMLKNHRADCVAVYRGRSYLAERGRASHSRAGIQHRRGAEDFLRSQDGEHRSPERRCTTELYALRDDDVEIVCGVPLGVNLLCLGEDHQLPMRRGGHRRRVDVTGPSHPATSPTGSASTLPSSTGMWFTMDPSCWHAALCEIPSPAQLWSATGLRRFTIVRCDVGVVLHPNPAGGGSRSIARAAAAFSVRLPVLRTLEPFRGYVPNNR